jgi:hypothetical protein
MIKNQSGQAIGAQMTNASTGAAFTGAVTVYLTPDALTQALGTVAAGVCTHEGNGYHTYRPSQAETNYDLIAFTFVGTGAITETIQVETETAAQSAAVSQAAAIGAITARDLIASAFRLIGVQASGENLDPAMGADALLTFSQMLDAWAGDRLTIYSQSRTENTLVSGTQRYSIGAGGNWSQARPLWIDGAAWLTSDGLESPISVFTRSEWRSVSLKNLQSILPAGLFYNPTFPLGAIDLWPVPTDATVKLVLYAPSAALTSVASLDTLISAPEGWAQALRFNLAVLLYPEYPNAGGLDPIVRETAIESKATIMRHTIGMLDELEVRRGAPVRRRFVVAV